MGQYDNESQVLGQEAPEELLELFTGIRGAEAVRQDPKIAISSVQIDHLYRHGAGFKQLEFVKQYRAEQTGDQILKYRAFLYLAYGPPVVEQHLIVMCEDDAPAHIPDYFERIDPFFEQRVRFRVTKLWEMDPEHAFRLGHPSLLPWILVMGSTPEQIRRAVDLIKRDPRSEVLMQRAATLAPLRLTQPEIDEIMVKGRQTMKIKELVEGTWLHDEIKREGLVEGLEQGREQGLEQGLEQGSQTLRDIIRRQTLKRLPSAGSLPRLDSVHSLEELQACLDAVLDTDSPAELRRLIERYR